MEKYLYILRGVPGCGKSTVANSMREIKVIEADEYWYDKKGNYKFDRLRLKKAHLDCQRRCIEAMQKNTKRICIANTNTSSKEMRIYRQLAYIYEYTVFSLVVENRHGGKSVHGVPDEIAEAMAVNLKNSIMLKPGFDMNDD